MSLAAAATLHFTLSMLLWLLIAYFTAPPKAITASIARWLWWLVVSGAGPCAVVFIASALSLVLVLRRRRTGVVLLVLVLGGSVLLFWYDASHSRYQVHVTATAPDRHHIYLTWWWYDDRVLR